MIITHDDSFNAIHEQSPRIGGNEQASKATRRDDTDEDKSGEEQKASCQERPTDGSRIAYWWCDIGKSLPSANFLLADRESEMHLRELIERSLEI